MSVTEVRYSAQGLLLARRLLERQVSFVEVTLGGWDTHYYNFESVRRLCGTLCPWAALMRDLQDRGLLESTLIVWMGEFVHASDQLQKPVRPLSKSLECSRWRRHQGRKYRRSLQR